MTEVSFSLGLFLVLHYILQHLHFNGCFQDKSGLPSISVFLSPLIPKRTFMDTLYKPCPMCRPANSVKVLKGTQSAEPCQVKSLTWLIGSWSVTRLLRQRRCYLSASSRTVVPSWSCASEDADLCELSWTLYKNWTGSFMSLSFCMCGILVVHRDNWSS